MSYALNREPLSKCHCLSNKTLLVSLSLGYDRLTLAGILFQCSITYVCSAIINGGYCRLWEQFWAEHAQKCVCLPPVNTVCNGRTKHKPSNQFSKGTEISSINIGIGSKGPFTTSSQQRDEGEPLGLLYSPHLLQPATLKLNRLVFSQLKKEPSTSVMISMFCGRSLASMVKWGVNIGKCPNLRFRSAHFVSRG